MISLDLYINLVTKSKDKVFLTYKKPKGGTGYCHIHPQPYFHFMAPEHQYAYRGIFKIDLNYYKNLENLRFKFFKNDTYTGIYLKLEDVTLQNQKKAKILELLYGQI